MTSGAMASCRVLFRVSCSNSHFLPAVGLQRSLLQAQRSSTPAIINCQRWKSTVSASQDSHKPLEHGQIKNDIMDNKVNENLKQVKEGDFSFTKHPEKLEHFRSSTEVKPKDPSTSDLAKDKKVPPMGAVSLPHPIWTEEELHNIEITHKNPKGIIDRMAFASVKTLRWSFDTLVGFARGRNESKWLTRICFLETVAGVPGMVAAMVRHLHSLRRMRRDHGWIHTLLEEAENERMHLMTALQLKQPSFFFRSGVLVTQGVFVTGFSIAYLVSPKFCHRFVGYLEEEAVITYSKLLKDMEPGGVMDHWNTMAAPDVAITYWKLEKTATMRDVVLAIRADEAHHRVVNHTLASMKSDDYNPYRPGE